MLVHRINKKWCNSISFKFFMNILCGAAFISEIFLTALHYNMGIWNIKFRISICFHYIMSRLKSKAHEFVILSWWTLLHLTDYDFSCIFCCLFINNLISEWYLLLCLHQVTDCLDLSALILRVHIYTLFNCLFQLQNL